MRRSTIAIAMAAAWLALAGAPGRAAELGPLPPDAVSHSRMSGADEFIVYIVFDPKQFADALPPGLEFASLEKVAEKSPDVADYLRDHPERRGWAWSYFEIIGLRDMAYDGRAASLGPHGGMAVWYASVRRADRSDPRPKGYNQIALGTWVSDRALVAHMRARGYPAAFGKVDFRRAAHRAHARLEAPGLKVEASCRLRGRPFTPSWAADTYSYQTVWTPRPDPAGFEVVSWSGHRQLDCADTKWRFSGAHGLVDAFRRRAIGGPYVSGTEFAIGYDLQGGLYRSH